MCSPCSYAANVEDAFVWIETFTLIDTPYFDSGSHFFFFLVRALHYPANRSASQYNYQPCLLLLLSKFNAGNFSNISSSDKSDFQPYAAKTASSSPLCARRDK